MNGKSHLTKDAPVFEKVPIIVQNYCLIVLKSDRFTPLPLTFDWYILLKPAFSIRAVFILVLYVIWNSSVLYILQHGIDLLVKEGRAPTLAPITYYGRAQWIYVFLESHCNLLSASTSHPSQVHFISCDFQSNIKYFCC